MKLLISVATASMLAGSLLTGYWGHLEIVAQYRLRLKESELRQDVLRGAINLITRTKEEAYWAKVAAASKLMKEEK